MLAFFRSKASGVVFLGVASLFLWSAVFAQGNHPDGFAAENALGQNGTTGGAGGTAVTVTTTADFLDYIFRTEPFIIHVADTIELASMAPFRSNKTVIGVADKGVITGSGLNLSSVSNIILRNLLIENSNDDAINIQEGSHHIWVDHCDLRSSFDGLLDIKRGSDYVTVSWNTFSNHDKTSLIGHDDNNAAQDSGKFHVTYHHNWFNDTVQRHPRVRFSALAHIYNNYYVGNNYGVGSTMDANVLVESNYFLNVDNPTLVNVGVSAQGDLAERNNIFDNCVNAPETRGDVPEPPYAFTPDATADVPAIVQAGAGRAGFVSPGQQWQVYDASVLPADNLPPYLEDNVVTPPDTTVWVVDDPEIPGNKLLEFKTPGANRIMYGLDWNMNPVDGATVAFRVKPIDPMAYDRIFEVEYRDGALRERLFLLPGGVVELDRADVTAQLPSETDGWHTYRITYQNGTSTVYVDEEPVPFLSGITASANSTNDLRFGDGSDGNTYGFYLDWIVFDTTGTYSPGESNIPDGLHVDRVPPQPAPWAIYDASVLPAENDPPFLEENTVTPPDTTARVVDDPEIPGNKLLEFITPGANRIMYGIDWAMAAEKGATMAFRVKPVDATVYDRVFEVEYRHNVLRERLFVLPDGQVELDRADVSAPLAYRTDGWHTYRITFQNGSSTVYLDEQPVPFLSGVTASANSTNDLRWGDGSDGNTYGFYLDWFIFDTSGVYAPGEKDIPEGLFVDDPPPAADKWMVYDAGVLPQENDPAYLPENEVNPPDTTVWVIDDPDIAGNKLLQFITPDANRIMFGNDWGIKPDQGATIAFRMKPIDATLYQRTIEVEYRDGILRERLFVLPGGVVELDRADVTATLPNNADGWHTYRITYQNGVSTVYVDEHPAPLLSGTTTSLNSTSDIRWGDGSDGNTYGFYLDWFIYDTTGVYAPGESIIPDSLFVDEPVLSIDDDDSNQALPTTYALSQNYPNPFNPSTTIAFQMPKSGHATLQIFNMLGQLVATLVDNQLPAGRHSVVFKTGEFASGIYFYRLQTCDFSQTKKMMFMK